MSIPSTSRSVQMGAMADRAASVSRQLRPAMLPLSSTRKRVSNWLRNAYGESVPVVWLAIGVCATGVKLEVPLGGIQVLLLRNLAG